MILVRPIHTTRVLLITFLLFAKSVFAQEIIKVNTVETAAGVSVTAKNITLSSVVLRFTTSGRNIDSACLQTCIVDIAAKQEIVIDKISALNSKKNWQYSTQYISHLGARVAHYDTEYMYWPAFKHGEKYYLSQGFNGNFSHQGINAIDFSLPESTPVHAARSGQVVWVEEAFKAGGLSAHFKNKANYISIAHSDGTQATYAHLKYKGSLVNPGDRVAKGQHIGFSGKTGYGKGPHLHFEVTRITPQGEYESLPFKIRSRHGLSEYPKVGFYYAIDSTKPFVNEVYADEIDFNPYFDQDQAVTVKSVKDRQLKIDDYVLIYIQNGKPRAIKVEINVNLFGYESLRTIPAELVIKPGTEKLIAVVYQTPGAQSSKFTYSYKYHEIR